MSGSLTNLLGLLIVLAGVLLLIVFTFLARRGFRPPLRPLSGYEAFPRQVGQAVESGGRVHVSLGPNGIIGEDTATTIAGLTVLETITRASVISDRQPVATTGDATALPVVSDTVRRVYRDSELPKAYDPKAIRLVALDPVALAGGATSIIADEDVRANVIVGSFGPEVALMAEAGERLRIPQTIGSDRLEGQAAAFAMADHALIGEEIFVARAYLTEEPAAWASLASQDVLRWFVILIIVIGVILKTLGLSG
ncbi:MAG TPA: hypothetical protein ENI95_14530 [Chloroflexi bacterium]|nr:hypothetical protein [Chloroflexota bacterium]